MLHEESFHVAHKFGAQKDLLNSFGPIGEESDGKVEVSVGKVLLRSLCSMKGETENNELALVLYVECVRLTNKFDQTLTYLCLQYATAGSADEKHVVSNWRKSRDSLAADKWFVAISFQSILNTVRVVRANIADHPITARLAWIRHWF